MSVLRSGIPELYPSNQDVFDDEFRFYLNHMGLYYEVWDEQYDDPLILDQIYLDNPMLDLCNWYLKHRTRVLHPSIPYYEWESNGTWFDLFTSDESSFSTLKLCPCPTLDLENRPHWRTLGFDFEPGSDQWEDRRFGRARHPYQPCGDLLANAAQLILDCSEPYPGDVGEWGCLSSRFSISKDPEQEGIYVVEDFLREHLTIMDEVDLKKHTNAVGMSYARTCTEIAGLPLPDMSTIPHLTMGLTLEDSISIILRENQPYWLDQITDGYIDNRFKVSYHPKITDTLIIRDKAWDAQVELPIAYIQDETFDLPNWYNDQIPFITEKWVLSVDDYNLYDEDGERRREHPIPNPALNARQDTPDWDFPNLELNGVQVPRGTYPAVQRNAASVKASRVVPKPIVITVKINNHPARALLDSGSLGDFMSSTLADQLKVDRVKLELPLGLQLAIQGSRSKINTGTKVSVQYEGIDEVRYFDIINLSNYDLILGTPWLFQHQVCVVFNPARVVVGSDVSTELKGSAISKVASRSLTVDADEIEQARKELMDYAEPICRTASETELPPFRAINHTIPLIDENKIYPWRPSRCPEAFHTQWAEKRDSYLASGRWKVTSSGNTVPMLLIPKPHRPPGTPPVLRTVFDLRARNDNTRKMTSPLPDPEGILRRTVSKKFRSLMDGRDAYEQIRVEPSHVERTAVTTPDGNMVSQVIQIGDCNAPATYQALMNHIFSPYIGRFMDVYLDDIVVYSDTLKEHIEHVKLIIDILKRERLFLSQNKLHFLKNSLKVLGRLLNDNGIQMDPDKVDSVLNWKTPTNRDLLRGFLGSVGYLADDIPNVRIPMGILHGLTGDAVSFRWSYTEQRAFEDVKALVHAARGHHRVPLDYSKDAPQIWMVTDGCSTGVAGLVSQGSDWRDAKIAAFYSAKLNSAQQNYPVHEIEMLAGIETMLRQRDLLQGASFKWITDHKGLIHLMKQKNLSGRQARWLEKISEFDFEVIYVPGTENVVADALSRLYSNDDSRTVRSRSEYTYFDVLDEDQPETSIPMPILAGIEARVAVVKRPRKVVPPAETGRAETAKEFAARMKNHFVLRGPVERKEGGNSTITKTGTTTQTSNLTNTGSSNSEPVENSHNNEVMTMPYDVSLLKIVSEATEGLDLEKELQGKYTTDPVFKKIVEKPSNFKNFSVKNGLIYI